MGETTQKVGNSSILSVEERRNIVRSFVNAYLRGSVKVTIWLGPTRPYMLSTQKEMSNSDLVALKKGFLDSVSIVSGAMPSTQAEIDQAIEHLFTMIVAYRGGDFIKGEFLQSPELETRLSALEVRVGNMEKLIEDLQHIWKVRGSQP